MNSLFQTQSKRSRRRALGTLLLALPLSGIASPLSPAQAQPATTLPAKKSPLSPEQKVAADKVMAMVRQQKVCNTPIDLKVTGATLEDVIAHIKAAFPNQVIAIEVRDAHRVRMDFDLQGVRIGDALASVATLAGCKLFVFSSGLLIAPPSQLTDAEKQSIKQTEGGEWVKSVENAGSSGTFWSNGTKADQLFARAIAQEVTGSDAKPFPSANVKTTFGNFSPECQAMLQQIVDSSMEGARQLTPWATPFHLTADAPIAVDTTDPKAVHITINNGSSDPHAGMIGVKINLR